MVYRIFWLAIFFWFKNQYIPWKQDLFSPQLTAHIVLTCEQRTKIAYIKKNL